VKVGDLVKVCPDSLSGIRFASQGAGGDTELYKKYVNRVGLIVSVAPLESVDGDSVMVQWNDDPNPELEYCDGLIILNEAQKNEV